MSDSSSNGDLVVVDVEMHDGEYNTGVLIAPNKLTWVCTREELEEEFPALQPILVSYIDSSTLFTTNWVHTFDEEETTLQNHRSLEQYVQTEEDCCRFVDVHALTACDGLYNITKQLTKLIELVPFEIYKWIGESCPESGMLWRDNFENSFQYIQPFLNAFPEANQSAQQLQMILSNHTVHSVRNMLPVTRTSHCVLQFKALRNRLHWGGIAGEASSSSQEGCTVRVVQGPDHRCRVTHAKLFADVVTA